MRSLFSLLSLFFILCPVSKLGGTDSRRSSGRSRWPVVELLLEFTVPTLPSPAAVTPDEAVVLAVVLRMPPDVGESLRAPVESTLPAPVLWTSPVTRKVVPKIAALFSTVLRVVVVLPELAMSTLALWEPPVTVVTPFVQAAPRASMLLF